jgi:2-polyprenyl-6-methoxyphenol hydroxylase-like FAD-dependent oxidoreductase
MNSFDIAIHGAGFVGQALALALAHSGFNVALIGADRKDAHVNETGLSDIRAFALGSAAKTLLEQLGAWPAETYATPVHSMRVFGDAGGRLEFGETAINTQAASSLNWIVDVPALIQKLKDAVAGSPHITRLSKADGLQATVHAVCEGRHSELRNQFNLAVETIRYPQHAIATRLTCDLPHGNVARQWFNDKGEVLALLPLAGDAVALVWSLDSDHAKVMMEANEAEFTVALEAACSKALGDMTLCSQRVLWPLTLSKVSPWTGCLDGTNWVLAGDAAHTVHPLAGQGLNLGFGDAVLLAQTLQALKATSPLFKPSPTQLGRALRRYARARRAAAAHIASATDGLQLLFSHDNPLAAPLRNHGMALFNRVGFIKNKLIQLAQ